MSCPTRLAAVLLCALAASVPATPARADVSGTQIVTFLNAQRAAHGFPADLVEDRALSDACARHNAYGVRNGVLSHDEDPARPGYSASGAAAARNAVLYQGTTWTAQANPFERAPIHLMQLLSPLIDRLGASENGGYGCATTLASLGHAQPAADTLFVYPGDGTRGWRASEVDEEGPFTPGETAGVPQGTTTGPTLYALAGGPGVLWTSPSQVISATLTGPAGTVPLLTFDRSSPRVGEYLPAGAMLLPRTPLEPGTTYTAALRVQVSTGDGPREFARTWSFTTQAAAPDAAAMARPCTTRLRFGGLARNAAGVRRLTVRATVCSPATLRVKLRRGPGTALSRTVALKPGERTVRVAIPRRVRGGRYTIRVTLAGASFTLTRVIPSAR